MQIYRVGGAVRDRLLGLPVQDHDYVVVGATAEEMVAQGFIPVGKDFPVFLHPGTHEEYALARTERKSGRGYKAFQIYASPEVTLEEDLARRDLTINAIAEDLDGRLIDPFHGQRDLKAGMLRHVSAAFVEDPVRILRVARFAARFQFTVAPETMLLMQRMVEAGEAHALVPERVWQEISRGLSEKAPATLFYVLQQANALAVILPELAQYFTPALGATLNQMAQQKESLLRRFAVLVFALPEPELLSLAKRLRLPQAFLSLATLLAREHEALQNACLLDADSLLTTLLRCDVIRRFSRFEDALAVLLWRCPEAKKSTDFLRLAATHLRRIDGGKIAAQCRVSADIPRAIRAVQCEVLAQLMASGV